MKRFFVYLFFVASAVILLYMFRIYKIEGTSMNYGLVEGDVVVCERQIENIRRGELLVLRHPLDPKHRLYIKRCAALPGDRFFQEHRRFYLQINGDSNATYALAQHHDLKIVSTSEGYFLENPYKKYYGVVHNWHLRVPKKLTTLPVTRVPQGHYYMLGDYRDNSADSRFFGAVPRMWIMSKVIYVVKKPRNWLSLLQIKEADSPDDNDTAYRGMYPRDFRR